MKISLLTNKEEALKIVTNRPVQNVLKLLTTITFDYDSESDNVYVDFAKNTITAEVFYDFLLNVRNCEYTDLEELCKFIMKHNPTIEQETVNSILVHHKLDTK